eukprot:CAMPEP_0170174738 /NCGR_PEP_ID=MMETSP0040_2-20121228/7942_1 /TAXON_ID=641309 /ORGANISM="Lotharella oceanica, Strain CCMP622" /LENGTH=392 /DNA_ID=CAMNT_0010416499 /DNA_START=21 /DNA_END=1199 /DNA_ORIENTATION=+
MDTGSDAKASTGPVRLTLPDIPPQFVPINARVDELDLLRAELRNTLRRFDMLLDARRDSIERKENILFAIQGGSPALGVQPAPQPKMEVMDVAKARTEIEDEAEGKMKNTATTMAQAMQKGMSVVKRRSQNVRTAEGQLQRVTATPRVRLSLYKSLQDAKAEDIKNFVLSHILEAPSVELSSLYKIMGGDVIPKEEVAFSEFRLWIHEAIGESTFPRGVIRIIHEYNGSVSPQGLPYTFTQSSNYAGLPNDYATLVDGKHGWPGAATNAGPMEWMQADFGTSVVPTSVTLSEPMFGAFQTGGWAGGAYLNNMRIVVPQRYAREISDPAKHVTFMAGGEVWVEVGDYSNHHVHPSDGNAIVIPITLSRSGSPLFRLCSRAANVWLATGTLEFD